MSYLFVRGAYAYSDRATVRVIHRIDGMNIRYGLHENLARRLVFLDGVTRSGKSLFSGILCSLERAEHIRCCYLLEQITPAVGLGTLDASLARSLLRVQFNEMVYDQQLARNVNFRTDDQTGIWNDRDPKRYFDRLHRREGDATTDAIRSSDTFLPMQTHDLMVNLESLDQFDLDYRMIELYRHPVDNLYSWWTRGWGERFLHDPRAFTLSLEIDAQLVPWYCAGYERQWLAMNPMERCVRTGIDLIERSVDQQRKAAHPERILTVFFEDFVTEPRREIERICAFLGTSATWYTERAISEARCPRMPDPRARAEKLEQFQAGIRRDLFAQLIGCVREYESSRYGLVSVPHARASVVH